MSSILVHAENDSAFEGRLQVALDLARRFEGHATLLIATPLQQFVSFDPFGGTYFAAEALAAAQADDLALESRLAEQRSEEHTSELQSLMRISYAVFCLKKKTNQNQDSIK